MKSWLWVVTPLENGCGTHWVLFICIVFIMSIRWKLFQSLKNYVGHFFLPFKCLFFLILEKKLTLSNQIFRKWGWDSVNFFIWGFSIVGIEESCFKAPKVLLDECFYNWNVHFFEFWKENWLWVIPYSDCGCGTVIQAYMTLTWSKSIDI